MLYHLYELHRASLAPARLAAQQSRLVADHPFNPFRGTHAARSVAAACDLFEQVTRRRGKPAFDIPGASERIAASLHFCDLVHFERESGPARPRLLIVAPMSGHFATLLRGTVSRLLADHDLYITDWADARDVPLYRGVFDLDAYIDTIIALMRYLGPGTPVMAVCQPAVPVLAAAALMAADNDPATPPAMVLMGGPIDTRVNPTRVNRAAESLPLEWFESHGISRVPWPHAGMMRRVYPGFLQLAGFMSQNLDRHVNAHWVMFRHLVRGDGEEAAATRRFYEEYRATMDLDAAYFLQTVRTVFQQHDLPRGVMASRGRPVEPQALTQSALMTVEGSLDDICPPGQTRAAHGLCENIPNRLRADHEQPGVGHYGIFNGRRWRETIAPLVSAFLRHHTRR